MYRASLSLQGKALEAQAGIVHEALPRCSRSILGPLVEPHALKAEQLKQVRTCLTTHFSHTLQLMMS